MLYCSYTRHINSTKTEAEKNVVKKRRPNKEVRDRVLYVRLNFQTGSMDITLEKNRL